MKALEILKNCRERGQKRAGGLDLDEAIAELEEAMKPKSCDGCIFYTSLSCPIEEFSITSEELEKHPFYCNRYEAKDNQ